MLTAGAAQRRMQTLPVANVDTLLRGRNPLILAPHPDDESLGCGGLIAAGRAAGLDPAVLVITDGTGSHPNSRAYPAERLRALREAEAATAVASLGLASNRLAFLRLRDTQAPSSGPEFDAAVAAVISTARTYGCGVLLATWRHDPHCDHLATHMIAREAAKQANFVHLAYPVWGWTLAADQILEGPVPSGFRLDIAAHLSAKRHAIAAHRSQRGLVVMDDPAGFRLAPEFLACFETPFETYLTCR